MGVTADSEAWDVPSSSTRLVRRSQPVRDDWEDDDDETEVRESSTPQTTPEVATDNKHIWEQANARAPAPMPTLLRTPSTQPTNTPPPGAFQPAMRILKRPSNNTNGSPILSDNSVSSQETLQDREARYQAARVRIFGEKGQTESGGNNGVSVVREPKGPAEESIPKSTDAGQQSAAGFGERRTAMRRPPPRTQS